MRSHLLVLLFLFPSICAAMNELAIRDAISEESTRHFDTREFYTLNDLEERLRISNGRTSSGLTKLPIFYDHAFNSIESSDRDVVVNEWNRKFEIVDEWIAATPEAPAPYLSKARMLLSYASYHRGDAIARHVSERNMRLFRLNVESARQLLEDSAHITGSNPYWFQLMALIARFQGWSEEALLELFQDGLEVANNIHQFYFTVAGYYQPMWYGSPEKMRDFVAQAVANTTEDPDELYTRIYWSQVHYLQTGNIMSEWADWDRMKKGFEKLLLRYPDSAWTRNAYAYFACKATDVETADRLLNEIGDNFVEDVWGPWQPRGLMEACKTFIREQTAQGSSNHR